MLKIDIHTHIVPKNLNEITNTFMDPRFLKLNFSDNKNGTLEAGGVQFRKIECNSWCEKNRLKDIKKQYIDVQVLSTIPVLFSYWSKPNECLILSRYINNHIHEICVNNNNKFIGLGTIPMQDTTLAIEEMDRCINDLSLSGIEIGTNINGLNLSESRFHPIFEHAEKISCPIFVHPWEMMGMTEMKKYWLPWLVGMPAETSRAICSLIFGGVFEKYPDLKICFAHGGGTFPFIAGRIDHGFKVRPDICAVDNSILPSSYLENFYVDSLVHDKNAFRFLLDTIGENRIAVGSDYPFPLGEKYPGELINSMELSDIAKKRIYSGTALEWLGLEEGNFI